MGNVKKGLLLPRKEYNRIIMVSFLLLHRIWKRTLFWGQSWSVPWRNEEEIPNSYWKHKATKGEEMVLYLWGMWGLLFVLFRIFLVCSANYIVTYWFIRTKVTIYMSTDIVVYHFQSKYNDQRQHKALN